MTGVSGGTSQGESERRHRRMWKKVDTIATSGNVLCLSTASSIPLDLETPPKRVTRDPREGKGWAVLLVEGQEGLGGRVHNVTDWITAIRARQLLERWIEVPFLLSTST